MVLTTTDTMTAAVTTTVWVVCGIHNNTTDSWADTFTAHTPSFTVLNVLVLFVTDNTDTCRTFNIY